MAIRSPCYTTDGWLSKLGADPLRLAGISLALAIRTTGLFPTILLQMTALGEEPGSLDDILDKVADHVEAAVDNAVDTLRHLIAPIIISVLGVLIGGLMIAMYLPIFMLGPIV